MKLRVNEGPTDRIVRLFIGVVLLNVAAVATGSLFYAALVVGVIGLVTGLTGFCPTYLLFGLDTRSRNSPTPGGE